MYFDLKIELFMVFIGKKVEIVGINFLLNILCSVYYYFVYISLNIKGKMVSVLCLRYKIVLDFVGDIICIGI